MPEILKLETPGASVSMLVDRVARAKSKFGQDYVFTGTVEPGRQLSVYVPEKATERQLANVLHVADAQDLVRRFLTIARSEKPGANNQLYWNITFAEQESFASVPPRAPTPAPAMAGASSAGRLLPNETGDEDYFPSAPAPRVREQQPSLPPVRNGNGNGHGNGHPKPGEPVGDGERDAVEQKRRARMSVLRSRWHALWESEAEFQLDAAERLAQKYPAFPRLEVNAASVNAGAASQFIEYCRSGLL